MRSRNLKWRFEWGDYRQQWEKQKGFNYWVYTWQRLDVFMKKVPFNFPSVSIPFFLYGNKE